MLALAYNLIQNRVVLKFIKYKFYSFVKLKFIRYLINFKILIAKIYKQKSQIKQDLLRIAAFA